MDQNTTDFLPELHQLCLDLFAIVGHTPEESEEQYLILMGKTSQLAIAQLIATLEEPVRNELLKQLQASKTVEKALPLVTKHFPPEQFQQAMVEKFSQLMTLYFGEINEELSEEQKEKIVQLLGKILL